MNSNLKNNQCNFEIEHWAACSEGFGEIGSDSNPEGPKVTNAWQPDTSFIPKSISRKMSRLSKMALNVAERCAGNQHFPSVFCSRYGEYENTFSFMNAIIAKELPSPMAFSHSVHNTASSHYSIITKNHARSIALAGGKDVMEQALVTACLLSSAERVLVVYHDDVLPEIYKELVDVMPKAFALGMLIRPLQNDQYSENSMHACLSWEPKRDQSSDKTNFASALTLIDTLRTKNGNYEVSGPRLIWKWHVT